MKKESKLQIRKKTKPEQLLSSVGPKHSQSSTNKKTSIIRSSAAEYLTYVAASGGKGVAAVYADENVWLTQKMIGVLYDVETHTINYHLKKVFADSELEENSVIRNFRITANDGKSYNTSFYNLDAIISVVNDDLVEGIPQAKNYADKLAVRHTHVPT